jgi:hypothetical protein
MINDIPDNMKENQTCIIQVGLNLDYSKNIVTGQFMMNGWK